MPHLPRSRDSKTLPARIAWWGTFANDYRHLRVTGDEIKGVAVAVRRQLQGHTHTGILHRHTNGQLFLLHLGGDCDLTCEVFDGTFAWVTPDLLPEEVNE